ncbi:MAG: MarR family winged helix-turn-helix transcriptional regulator [Candidatus Dormibacteria bacterium]
MQSQSATETAAGLSPDVLATWHAFLRAHTLVARALERELLTSQRLPLAEYDVLVQLSEAPEGRLRMAQLADRVLLSRSGLTRLIERLEAGGLVRREVCPSDARGAFAVLTEDGMARLEVAAHDHLRSVQAHFGDALDSELMDQLRCALEQVAAANMGESAGGCAAVPEVNVAQEDGLD